MLYDVKCCLERGKRTTDKKTRVAQLLALTLTEPKVWVYCGGPTPEYVRPGTLLYRKSLKLKLIPHIVTELVYLSLKLSTVIRISSRERPTNHATFSTRRGSWERDNPLLGTVGVASPDICQITSFPAGENRKDSIKRERTTSKE